MILENKLEKPYDLCTIRSNIWLSCDYCGKEFQRIKKSRIRLNKNIDKDSCGSKECRNKKQEDVCLLLYGQKSLFQSAEFIEKQKQSNIEKYGTESYFSSEDFKNKRETALIEKYGVKSPLQSEEIRLKQQETCLEKYGVENYAKCPERKEKTKKTNLEKYGVEHAMQSVEVVAKRDETCLEKYGTKSYTQTSEYWDKRKKTCFEKYGVEHPSQLKENREKAKKTCVDRFGVDNFAKTDQFKEQFANTCLEKYGVPNALMLKQNQVYGKTQQLIQEWLNSYGLNFKHNHLFLSGKEIDLYDDNLKIAIEYCGLYWHNELSPQPRLKDYHYDKYKSCLQQGIRLITIFEDEWKNKNEQCKGILKSILKLNTKIGARSCEVKELGKVKFYDFCEENHLIGKCNSGLVFYALFNKDDLIGVMSFGRHHRDKSLITLDRMCFKIGIQVIGGASKLLSQCLGWAKKNGYNQIISFSDNRWSSGSVYETLGFRLDKELSPDYSYVDFKKPYKRISKQSQKKSNTGCPPEMTEREWTLQNGLARIWDCGKKRWVFEL